MKAIATGDRILDEGVDAWVEGSDFSGRLASVRATTCSVLRARHRGVFRPSKVPRELLAFVRLLDTAPEPFDRLQRAERRMLQLGAKSRGAVAFGDTLNEFAAADFAGTSTSSSGTSVDLGPLQDT